MASTLREDNTMKTYRRMAFILAYMTSMASMASMAMMTFMNTGCAQHGGTAFSQDATKLSGTWIGASTTLNSRGETSTHKTITLLVSENGGIRGSAQWTKLNGPGGHKENQESDKDAEQLIGSLNKEDGVFFLVETSETGFWSGKVINANQINAHLIQSGKQHVSTFVEFTRLDEAE